MIYVSSICLSVCLSSSFRNAIMEDGKSEICRQAGRPQTQGGFLYYNPETEFLLQETSVFTLKAFNWLAHPHYGGYLPLLKIN